MGKDRQRLKPQIDKIKIGKATPPAFAYLPIAYLSFLPIWGFSLCLSPIVYPSCPRPGLPLPPIHHSSALSTSLPIHRSTLGPSPCHCPHSSP